jgi:hypothetical protein
MSQREWAQAIIIQMIEIEARRTIQDLEERAYLQGKIQGLHAAAELLSLIGR